MASFSQLNPSAPSAPKVQRLAGVVVKAHCSKPGFSTGVAEQANGHTFRYCSKIKALAIQEGDSLIFIGVLHTDKYGEQLMVQSVDAGVSQTVEGLELYLARNPKYTGIGPAAAARIALECGSVEAFMREADTLLDGETSILSAPALKLPQRALDALKEGWEQDRDTFIARVELAAYALSPKQIEDLVAEHGNAVTAIVKRDPYLILKTIKGYGFRRLDQIVTEKMGGDKGDPKRIRAAALACFTDRCIERGSTRMPWGAFTDSLYREYLMMDTHAQVAAAQREVGLMFTEQEDERGGAIPPLLIAPTIAGARDTITTRNMWLTERDIAKALEMAAKVPAPGRHDIACDERMTAEQRCALHNAMNLAASVIIGGAGVGKTYTMTQIVKAARAAGEKVELGAFTGKAASRMTEMLRDAGIHDKEIEGKTLHRILGADGQGFNRGDLHEKYVGLSGELPAIDLLIVDEVSMLDVFLAREVFSRWDPTRTRIVMIGDAAQLPSVGAGNILHDIITRQLAPVVELTQIQRQGGVLARMCQGVRAGNIPSTGATDEFGAYRVVDVRGAAARMGEQMFMQADPAKYAIGLVRRLFTDWIPAQAGLSVDDIQIVCPYRDPKQPINTASINRAVQEHLFGEGCPEVNPGDRIMQTENDYGVGVFNGQFGRVVSVDNPKKPKRVRVRMDQTPPGADENGECILEWKKLEVAYAVTVHKSQGSQFPGVIFACGASPAGMLVDRSLIYTGISRASKFAVICGDVASIANCARMHTASMRLTNLSLPSITEGEK